MTGLRLWLIGLALTSLLIGYHYLKVSSLEAEIDNLSSGLVATRLEAKLCKADLNATTTKLVEQNAAFEAIKVDTRALEQKIRSSKQEYEAKLRALKKPNVNDDKEVRRYYEGVFKRLSDE